MWSPREAELHYSEGPHRSGPSRRKRRGLEAVQGKLSIPYRQDSSGRLSARWGIVGKISRQRWSRSTSSTPPSQNHLGNTHSSLEPCGMSSMPPNQRKCLGQKARLTRICRQGTFTRTGLALEATRGNRKNGTRRMKLQQNLTPRKCLLISRSSGQGTVQGQG
uniref:Transposon protein, putative, CACTA, En/Spm sub-class, expressed n=1 Tax=Oryza sativa subsp. japonica TaxID=39947 RepID=Q109T8_ORYSJ|nr:transposon protein, putative, CACTA, En/Spm sub-class, expressed [Oryza sativa Japonica Group]